MIQISITNYGALDVSMAKKIDDTIHSWKVQIMRTEDEGIVFIEGDKITIGEVIK